MQNPDTVVNLALIFLAIAWGMCLVGLIAIICGCQQMRKAQKLHSTAGALLVLALKLAATQQVIHLYHYTASKSKGDK